MRARECCMTDGERDLLVVALVDADAGGVAAERAAAVGADRPAARASGPPLLSERVTASSSPGAMLATSSSIRRRLAKSAGALLERRDQMAVLDIVAEGVEIDFARPSNFTSGARHSRPVSSTMRMILSGAACAAHSSQTPRVSSAVTEPREQGGGAVVGPRRALADQHGGDAAGGQRNRRGQAGRAAAHHDGRRPFRRCYGVFVRHQSARSCLRVNGLARAGRKPRQSLRIRRRCAMHGQ